MIKDAFLTGSRVFGYGRDRSDYDIVVLCDKGDFPKPGEDDDEENPYIPETMPDTDMLRFGQLNFILCFTQDAFSKWKHATEACVEQMLNRDKAVKIFKAILKPEKPKNDREYIPLSKYPDLASELDNL